MLKSSHHSYNLVLILLLAVFFALYSFLAWSTIWPLARHFNHFIFNWPDENANYFFAAIFAKHGVLFFPEYLNVLSDNLLHSRSINVVDANLVPVAFLPTVAIFGLFFKFLGPWGILFFTPLLALITIYIIYRLSYLLWSDHKFSLTIAILLLSASPWLYFANFSFLPTVLFIFLLSAGYGCWARSLKVGDRHGLYWQGGTVLLSLAVVSRPSEIVWVAFIALFIIYLHRSVLDLKRLLASVFILLAIGAWSLGLNYLTYGHYLSFGYFDMQGGNLSSEFNDHTNSWRSWLILLFSPFGFDIKSIAYNFYHYFIRIGLYKVILALLAIIFLAVKYKRFSSMPKVWQRYFILVIPVFILILLYYGSWDIADPLVKSLNRLSSSYVRYFMPLYILILPLAAWALLKIFWRENKTVQLSFYFVLIVIAIVSIRGAFLVGPDGLLDTRQALLGYYQQFAVVREIAPPSSLILTNREDKIFFPYYKVVVPQGSLALWPRLASLVDRVPLYFYTNKSDEEIALDQQAAQQVNLELVEPVSIWEDFRLFKIIKKF